MGSLAHKSEYWDWTFVLDAEQSDCSVYFYGSICESSWLYGFICFIPSKLFSWYMAPQFPLNRTLVSGVALYQPSVECCGLITLHLPSFNLVRVWFPPVTSLVCWTWSRIVVLILMVISGIQECPLPLAIDAFSSSLVILFNRPIRPYQQNLNCRS